MSKLENLKSKADIIIDNIAYFVCQDKGTIEAINLNNLKETISFTLEEFSTVSTTMTIEKAIKNIDKFKKLWQYEV